MEFMFTPQVELGIDQLRDKLADIDSIPDTELYTLLRDYYKLILEDIFDKRAQNQRSDFIILFTKPKFIISLTSAIRSDQISDTAMQRLNTMCYDYLVACGDGDEYVGTLLIALAKVTNRYMISTLCTIPVAEDFAALLALARYSSPEEVVNVKRLNRVLMNQPVDMMSEQLIVDIYMTLFDHVLPLFTGVMLDVINQNDIPPNISEIYGLITLSILDIMNELPLSDIKRGLCLFDQNRKMMYPDNPLRFNLESIAPDDYPRILGAIDLLRKEGIFISTR